MKIRTKLSIGFLTIIIIPVLMLMIIMYFIVLSNFTRNWGEHLEDNVSQAAKAIDEFMFTRVHDLNAFSNNPIFSVGSIENASYYLSETVSAYPFYDTLSYADMEGVILASSDESLVGKNILKLEPDIKEEFRKTISGGPQDVYISDIADISQMELDAHSPLDIELLSDIVDKNGAKLGVLIGVVNNQFLEDIVFDIDERTIGDEYAYLVNDPGEIVITADSKAEILKSHPDLGIRNLKQKLEGDEDGYMVYVNSKGRKVISAYSDLSEYGTEGVGDWSLLSTAPYEDAMEPISRLFYWSLIFCLLMLIVIIFAIIFFSGTISKPILELVTATIDVGKRGPNVKVSIKSGDEIGILGSTFNNMAKQLDTTMGNLKQEIEGHNQAEEALRESEDKLRAVFENINEEIVYLDSQGTCLDVNKKVEDIFGYKPEELIGKSFAEIPFCQPDSLENIMELFNKATFGDFNNLIELKGIRKDGNEIDIEISTNTIEKDGEIKNIITVIRDITERKKAEVALRESEEKFHDLFDLSPLAVAVSELKTGKLIGVNNKYCELTKYAQEQILGKTTTELGFYSEKDRNRFVKELEASGEVHGLEMEFKLKDASITTLIFAKMVLIAGENLVITIFYDLTESRQAEAALRQSEEKYKQLADLLPQVVFETDEKGNLTFVNRIAFELFGYSEDDFKKGLHALEMIIPEDREKAESSVMRILGGKKSVGTEYTALRKDGSTYPALIYANPIMSKGHPIGLRGIMADLSEFKRTQAALRESEEKLARSKKMEALGLLAGGVAHDLNNILSGIVSYPELILMDLPDNSKLKKPIETMQESGNRAAAIVQDLLTVARGVATNKEPLDINALIRDYLNSPEFEKLQQFHSSVTVKTNLDPHLLNTNGSYVHIRKVIMNLVSNASEAIKGSGNVIILTTNRYVDKPLERYDDVSTGEYAVLSVTDDGSGISSDDLERIFDPFYTKKLMGRSGTGLGLSVVWNVVQDHEGYIDVITDEKGTTFELYFPITRDEVADRASDVPIESLKGEGQSILVIDDLESQREISCRMLDTLGYKTFAVSSGEDAIEYLKKHTVDLLLLDMIMDPGLNGRETYEGIIKIHPKQKAIIVSGFAETDEVKKTQKLGAGQYIKKPLTLERVGLTVKEELKK